MARVKKSRRSGYARLSSKNQVTIPQGALEALGLRPGDEFKVEVDRGGRIVLSPAAQTTAMRRAIEETSGVLVGVYPPDRVGKLRDEWR